VLEATGASQIDLAGHSAGGGLGYEYLEDPARAARVARYIHIGSFVNDGPAGPEDAPVPTLNLWSAGDTVVEGGDIEGATNVRLEEEDHYGVATSDASFVAIWRHLHEGNDPATTAFVPMDRLQVRGRALSLGENIPAEGAQVDIYEVGVSDGMRMPAQPVATVTTDAEGYWGPVELQPGVPHEFHVRPTGEEDRPIHYYREPFVRSNPGVYLRTLPAPGTLAGALLDGLPNDDSTAVLVNFTSSTAILAGRDSLTVEGIELATEDLARADQTTIALFLYDENGNGESDRTPIGLFSAFPFLNGYDLFFPGDANQTVTVRLNGRTLRAPRWPSASEGITITIFD
jgi:pimeloyl-ACP methyl ester carboxylesterase